MTPFGLVSSLISLEIAKNCFNNQRFRGIHNFWYSKVFMKSFKKHCSFFQFSSARYYFNEVWGLEALNTFAFPRCSWRILKNVATLFNFRRHVFVETVLLWWSVRFGGTQYFWLRKVFIKSFRKHFSWPFSIMASSTVFIMCSNFTWFSRFFVHHHFLSIKQFHRWKMISHL